MLSAFAAQKHARLALKTPACLCRAIAVRGNAQQEQGTRCPMALFLIMVPVAVLLRRLRTMLSPLESPSRLDHSTERPRTPADRPPFARSFISFDTVVRPRNTTSPRNDAPLFSL